MLTFVMITPFVSPLPEVIPVQPQPFPVATRGASRPSMCDNCRCPSHACEDSLSKIAQSPAKARDCAKKVRAIQPSRWVSPRAARKSSADQRSPSMLRCFKDASSAARSPAAARRPRCRLRPKARAICPASSSNAASDDKCSAVAVSTVTDWDSS